MIRASYAEMKNDAHEITNASEGYTQNVEKVYQEVDRLAENWKGVDNQQYVSKVNSYKEDMLSLGIAVDGYAKFLTRSANMLNDTQDSVADMAGRL